MASMFTRRFLAYLADFFVVSSFMWIISFLLYLVVNPYAMFTIYSYFPYVLPIITVLYFAWCEKEKGATVGKALLYLRVVTVLGTPISWPQAIVRNLTKIFWIPMVFDVAIGKYFKGDRILSRVTRTVVIDELNI